MSQPATAHMNIDLSRVDNPEVRRALRAMGQQAQAMIDQQQIQIEAMLEMLLDKNLGSLGEFKRHVQRISDRRDVRAERLHTQITQTFREHASAIAAEPTEPRTRSEPERQVYRLWEQVGFRSYCRQGEDSARHAALLIVDW